MEDGIRDDWWEYDEPRAISSLLNQRDRLREVLMLIAHGLDGDEFEDTADVLERHMEVAREALAPKEGE